LYPLLNKRGYNLTLSGGQLISLREEQRLEDEDDGANKLLLDTLIGDAYGDNEALDVRITY
jgi:hypothetical protein